MKPYNFNFPLNTSFKGKIRVPNKKDENGWFTSKEGAMAIKTNAYVARYTRARKKPEFIQATPEDYKILTDKSINAPLKRVRWFNPKNGKIYYIINDGEDKDGNYNVRILNEEGGFVKKAQIKPKRIVIADNFSTPIIKRFPEAELTPWQLPYIPHGQMVARFALVNNPFAKYEYINIAKGLGDTNRSLDETIEELREKDLSDTDIVSYSWANLMPNEFFEDFANAPTKDYPKIARRIIQEFDNDEEVEAMFCDIDGMAVLIDTIEALEKKGVKVFISSGNNGAEEFNFLLLAKNANGVGSISREGVVSDFNSSRSKFLTKHYELGEYKVKETPDGINYTGGNWTDYACNIDEIFTLRGKTVEECLIDREEFSKALSKKRRGSKDFCEIYEAWGKEGKILDTKMVARFFNVPVSNRYKDIYFSVANWASYKVDDNGKLQPYFEPIRGTSFSTPIRAARVALNESMEGII